MMEKAEAIRCRRFEQLLTSSSASSIKRSSASTFWNTSARSVSRNTRSGRLSISTSMIFATVHLPSQKSMRTSARSFRLTFLKVAVVTVARASSPTIQSSVTLLYDAKLKTGCIKMLYSIKFHNEPENFLTGLPRFRLSWLLHWRD